MKPYRGNSAKGTKISSILEGVKFSDCKGRRFKKTKVRQRADERFLVRFGPSDLCYKGRTQYFDRRIDQNSANLDPNRI